jgi:hypothetical protein
MICTRLAGGLGNQLFQFAAALALRGSQGSKVYLGTQGLSRYKVKRAFDMACLVELPSWCLTDAQPPAWAGIVNTLMAARVGRLLPYGGVSDRNFRQVLATTGKRGHNSTLWLDGYFQQGWEWPAFEATLAAIISMLRTDLPALAPPATDCVIHVRGADFLASAVHRVVDANYYIRAVEALQARSPGVKTAWVITDDHDHAAPMLAQLSRAHPAIEFEFSPRNPSSWMQDFMLMRQARSRIIGNSTFSWWAAALDPGHAVTVTPSQWMSGVPRDLFLPWEIPLPVA